MRRFRLTFVFLFISISALFSQGKDILYDLYQSSETGGMIVMEKDTLLAGLIDLQREVNKVKGGVDGFSITLFRGNNVNTARDGAEKVKAMFLLKYPDDVVYLKYEQPNWFVRVGDFKTYGEALKKRNELEKTLSEIKEDIYIVPKVVKIE